MFKTTLVLSFVLVSFATAHAQEFRAPIAIPGSVNASFGTTGPVEPNNVIGGATFEQGATAWRRGPLFVVGFVDVTLRADTRGYAWNNNLPYLAGGKLMISDLLLLYTLNHANAQSTVVRVRAAATAVVELPQ